MKKTVLITLVLALFNSSVFAQDILGDFSVSSIPVGSYNLSPNMSDSVQQAILDTVPHNFIFTFLVLDPSAVNIRLQLGTARETWNKFDATINLNGSNLPAGITLEKEGNSYKITIPKLLGVYHFYSSGRLELANGDYSRTHRVSK
ncbi:MAG: hypothetical protein ACO3EE_00840 [Flavobacteriales bacterium]